MIRNYRFLVVLSLFMLVFSHAALAGGGDKVAAAEQAWQMIDEGALLIDVRSASEFASGTIDGSVNIPHTEIENLVKLIGDDLDRSVVVYCRSGNRSGRAQTALEKLGYTGVFNATGYEALVATRP
jgi:phage shock protein E